MQIAQSEVVGTINNDGVGIRYVDTVLNDSGREQYVVIVVREVEDNLFQFLGLHLSVSDTYTRIGHVLLYNLGYMLQI